MELVSLSHQQKTVMKALHHLSRMVCLHLSEQRKELCHLSFLQKGEKTHTLTRWSTVMSSYIQKLHTTSLDRITQSLSSSQISLKTSNTFFLEKMWTFFSRRALSFFPELSELQSTEFPFPLRLRHIADTVSADWGRGKTQRHLCLLCQCGETLATHSQRLNSLVHVQFEISTAIRKRDTANKKIKKEILREQSSSVATNVVPKSEECLWIILVAIQWNSMTFVPFYAWHRMQNKQKGKEQLACDILCGCLKH